MKLVEKEGTGLRETTQVYKLVESGARGPAGAKGDQGIHGVDGEGVPIGGSTGQVLKKQSASDFDTDWEDESGGGGGIDYANPVSITGAASIPSTNAGKHHVCTGTTADYTVNLPTTGLTSGDLFSFEMSEDLTELVTIDALSGQLIDGHQTRVMWSGEKAVLKWNGTDWQKVNGVSKPMMCTMYPSANQSWVSGVNEKINLDASDDDPNNMADTINHNINILRRGQYELSSQLMYNSANATGTRADNQSILGDRGTFGLFWKEANNFQGVPGYLLQFVEAGDVAYIVGFYQSGSFTNTVILPGLLYNWVSVKEIPTW